MTASPAWTYLPVDDLRIPVAGLTCLGTLERKAMSYEILSGVAGFGVDEFPEVTAARKAAAAKTAVATTTIKAPTTSPTISLANLFSKAAVAPKVSTTTLPAIKTTIPTLLPLVKVAPDVAPQNPGAVAPGPIDQPCPYGYVLGPGGCVDPLAYKAPTVAPEDNTTLYLAAGGLVVAIGAAAYFLTRKGK